MLRISKFKLFNENTFFSKLSDLFKSGDKKPKEKRTMVTLMNEHYIWAYIVDEYNYKFYYIPGCEIVNNKPRGLITNKRLVGRIFKALDEWGNPTLKLYAYVYDTEIKNKYNMKMKNLDPDERIVAELMRQPVQPYRKLAEINPNADALLGRFLDYWMFNTTPGRKREKYLNLPEEERNPQLKPSKLILSAEEEYRQSLLKRNQK